LPEGAANQKPDKTICYALGNTVNSRLVTIPMKILFVCLGNICRSPLAEAIMMHKIEALGWQEEFIIDSCGTSTYNLGDGPDPRGIRCAHKRGVHMHHIARQLNRNDIESFDLILAMDQSNLDNIKSVAQENHHHKIRLMREFDPVGMGEVPDPYWGTDKDFDDVFDILNRSMDGLIQNLDKLNKVS
jgi:protein-tyrosine phosphatase